MLTLLIEQTDDSNPEQHLLEVILIKRPRRTKAKYIIVRFLKVMSSFSMSTEGTSSGLASNQQQPCQWSFE
jgi:hypothetical protein